MALDLSGIIQSLGAALGGYAEAGAALEQQRFENEMALADYALRKAQVEAGIGLTRAQIGEVESRTRLAEEEFARQKKMEALGIVGTQMGEIIKGISTGAISVKDPAAKRQLQDAYNQYREMVKEITGFEMSPSMYEPKRVLSPQDVDALMPFIERGNMDDPAQREVVSKLFNIDPEAVRGVKLGVTPSEERHYRILETQTDIDAAKAAATVIHNLTNNPAFLELPEVDQKATITAQLTPLLGADRAEIYASTLPRFKQAVSADTAAQVAATNLRTLKDYEAQMAGIRSQEAMQRERLKFERWAEQLRASTHIAEAKLRSATDLQIAGMRAGTPEATQAQRGEPNPVQARKNIEQVNSLLRDPMKAKRLLPADITNLANLTARNMMVLAKERFKGKYNFSPEVEQMWGTFIAADMRPSATPDEKGRIKSLEVWQDIESAMLAAGWPQEVIQWFYNERYASVFGPRQVGKATKATQAGKTKSAPKKPSKSK